MNASDPFVTKPARMFWSKFAKDRIGLSSCRNGCRRLEHRRDAAQEALALGQVAHRGRDRSCAGRRTATRGPARAPTRRWIVGARSSATGCRSLISGFVLRAKRLEPVERQPRLVQERREDRERLRQRVLRRSAVAWNVRCEFSISPRSWPLRSFSAPNTTPVLLHEQRQRLLLPVEHAEHVGAVGREPGQVAERRVQVLAAAVPRDRRGVRLPGPERLLRSACRRSCRISSSSTVALDLRPGQHVAVVQLRGAPPIRARAPRRSRRSATSAAGSPSCPSGAARTSARSSAVARAPPAPLFSSFLLDLADVDAGDPDVGLLGQRGGVAEVDLDLVACALRAAWRRRTRSTGTAARRSSPR